MSEEPRKIYIYADEWNRMIEGNRCPPAISTEDTNRVKREALVLEVLRSGYPTLEHEAQAIVALFDKQVAE